MKRKLQKFIVALLIIMTLFNFTFVHCTPVYASVLTDVRDKIMDIVGGIIGIFTWPDRLKAMAIGLGVNVLTAQVAYVDGRTDSNDSDLLATITPFEIFFNKVQILDVNFLNVNVKDSNSQAKNTSIIRNQVAKWYTIVKLIAITILLLILLYVGIRMAIASVASEKAVYKHALVDWIVSLCLVFILEYIIMFTVQANNAIVSALEKIDTAMGNNATSASEGIANIGWTALGISWQSISATVVYCIMVFQTLVFLFKYFKRMLTVGFLIIIAPLISITYSIDKLGDGKAQALNSWLKEFVYNILIQPFHCILYSAFVAMSFDLLAGEGIKSMVPGFSDTNQLAAGILAIVCILFIDTGEKIVRKIFGFEQASSLSALGTAAMAGTALGVAKQAPALAQNARKGINYAKQKGIQAKNNIDAFRNNRAIATEMKNNPGMTREDAQKAVDKKKSDARTAKGNKTVNEMSQRKKARREDKIAKQMQRTMGAAAYARLVANKDTSEGKEAFEAAHAAAATQVDKRSEHKDKVVKTALGAPGKFVKGAGKAFSGAKNAYNKIANSSGGKWFRNRMHGGSGIVLASLSLAAGQPLSAISAYNAGTSFSREMSRSSTGNIVHEISQYSDKKSANKEDCVENLYAIKQKGDNGAYESKSHENREIKKDLQNILSSMGLEQKMSQIIAQIQRDMMQDPKKFDLAASLRAVLGDTDNAKNPHLYQAAERFANHTSDGMVYEQIKYAGDMGEDINSLFNKVANQVQYVEATSATPTSVTTEESIRVSSDETVSTTIENTTERVGSDNVVENIERVENVETVINKIDETEVESAVQRINDKLQELRSIDLTGKTDEVKSQIQTQIDKFEDASRRLQGRMPNTNVEGDN